MTNPAGAHLEGTRDHPRCSGRGGAVMTCPECDGEGRVEELRCSRPHLPMGECCGGCTREIKCPRCAGTGEVEPVLDAEATR